MSRIRLIDQQENHHAHSIYGAVEIRDVVRTYRINEQVLPVLAGVNLDVRAGEFVSIVGRSGCGKSTLLRLIAGLDPDYEGEIHLDGTVIRGTSLDRGMVFQDAALFPWMTLQENVGFALLKRNDLSEEEKAHRVTEAIRLVNLTGFETAWPRQLSGGMAQRGAIARGLVNQPKLLLLDEPFGALDALTKTHLQRELQQIWMRQKNTMIMVTHDVEEAVFLGDKVVVMEAGPGGIRRTIRIPFPHPRDPTSSAFQRIKEEILNDLVGDGLLPGRD